jgi:hypothetical protein
MGWQMGVSAWLWILTAILLVVGVVVLIVGAIGGMSKGGRKDEAIETPRGPGRPG